MLRPLNAKSTGESTDETNKTSNQIMLALYGRCAGSGWDIRALLLDACGAAMSELQRKKEQLKSLQDEVKKLEIEDKLGKCYRLNSNNSEIAIYIKLLRIDQPSYLCDYMEIKETGGRDIDVNFRSNKRILELNLSPSKKIDNFLFKEKVRVMVNRMPMLQIAEDVA